MQRMILGYDQSRYCVHMLYQSASFLTAMTELPVLEPMAIKYIKYQLSV